MENTAPNRAAGDLVAARKALLANGIDAAPLRNALADLHELWLTTKAAELGITAHSGLAIIAVGGLGRRELLPHSDLDLILVHDESIAPEELSRVADSLWYPLWDAHIKLDHSVRTVAQAMRVATDDLTAALGMLEGRHIVGDEDLSRLLLSGVRQQWRADIRLRFAAVTEQAEARWAKYGEVAHRAEPDLKHGRGGMRDVQLLTALSIAQLTDGVPGLAQLRAGGVAALTGSTRRGGSGGGGSELGWAHHRLLDIRTELHRTAGRARDELRAQDADEIGAALRLGDRFDLARQLSNGARTISYSVDVGMRTAASSIPRRGLGKLRRTPLRRPLDEGVVSQNGEVVLAREANPARDSGLILRVGAAAAVHGLPISPATLERLAANTPEPREPWPSSSLADLLVLLGTGKNMVPVIEALDRTGLWGRVLPEWGVVRDLPPRDVIHTFTVDRHLVETVVNASRLVSSVSRPDLLLISALLHDIGKGRVAEHCAVGAELVVSIGHRMGMWPDDIATVAQVVRHHLLLPQLATRRDLDDPRTVQEVVDALGGSRLELELLVALAESDSLATGPGVWGEWKASLIAELARRAALVMTGDPLPEPAAIPADLLALAEQRFGATSDAGARTLIRLIPREEPRLYTVQVITRDVPGSLSKMAGVLAAAGLRTLEASAGSIPSDLGESGVAVNTFVVQPKFGTPPSEAILRTQLQASIEGTLDIEARLAVLTTDMGDPGDPEAPAVPMAPVGGFRLRWIDVPADSTQKLLEVRADDAPALLYRITRALERVGVDVRWAKLTTLGGRVIDTFALATDSLPEDLASVEAAVAGILPQPTVAAAANPRAAGG